jgi:outer membrane protein TolC
MRKTFCTIVAAATAAASASAQTPPARLQLTVDEAVQMALEHNLDLNVDRLDPQISDTDVAAAAGGFKPTFETGVNRNNQLQPPGNFLIPTPTRTDAVTSTAGLSQQLPFLGTSYEVAWNAVRTRSNSFLSSYDPLVQSGLTLSVSQPLVRDRSIDTWRRQLATSRTNRDIADTRLRESIVQTMAAVKTAYWNLAAAIANVTARTSALNLAQELARVNKAKVDVGQSPPLDLVSAQAEVADNEEQLIIAETAVRQAEDRLRMLIFDPTDRRVWNVRIDPIDPPPAVEPAPDIEAAVTQALAERIDLTRTQKDIENADISVRFTSNQRLPDVRVNASYRASGLGGTEVLRTPGFPGDIIGSGPGVDFGSVLGQLFSRDYPTWAVGVNLSYPLGQSSTEAAYARARLERVQAAERLKSNQARVIQQVRDAGWKVEMNAKRIETTRAARELATQRLDAEQKRFEVGLSTSFLVIQAQRDLAQADANQLSARLGYVLALIEFEALQQAGPAGQSEGGGGGGQGAAPSAGAAALSSGASTGLPVTGPAGITIPGGGF